MAFEIVFKLRSVGNLKDGPRIIDGAKSNALKVGGELLVTEIKKHTPVNTGALRASIAFVPRGSPGEGILASPLIYSSVMELGRRPGKFPPSAPIQLWVKRQLGISDPKEIRSVAFLVSRKIARAGVKGRNMFEKGIKKGWPRARRAMDSIITRIISQRLSA